MRSRLPKVKWRGTDNHRQPRTSIMTSTMMHWTKYARSSRVDGTKRSPCGSCKQCAALAYLLSKRQSIRNSRSTFCDSEPCRVELREQIADTSDRTGSRLSTKRHLRLRYLTKTTTRMARRVTRLCQVAQQLSSQAESIPPSWSCTGMRWHRARAISQQSVSEAPS